MLIMPLVVLAFAQALGIDGCAGAAAVVIGSLPVALAGFSISQMYEFGEDIAQSIFGGTVLMIPVALLWAAIAEQIYDTSQCQ